MSNPRSGLLVYPPPPKTGGIAVHRADLRCLGEAQFLNDVIIDFYLNVCLVLDNCSAQHIEDLELTNVKLKFLPPNCTSLIQPLDQGIINSIKCSYWWRLVHKLLLDLRLKCQTKVDIFQALEMLSASWKVTTKEDVKNCFRKAGFETPAAIKISQGSGQQGTTRRGFVLLYHSQRKYLMQEKVCEEVQRRTHVFSSFFYLRLTQRLNHRAQGQAGLTPAARRHRNVRTWTRHVDIFAKDFIVVPINQNSHWFLAMVCFPGLVARSCPPQEVPQEERVASAEQSPAASPQVPEDRIDSSQEDGESVLDSEPEEPLEAEDAENPLPKSFDATAE
ncbi:hypothetical protein HPB47_003684 [Ixodes persulcatus]|uniref:Uncharacterized protein n=1 Tax=Ixodes persulcatus TaxID=34615 RepID=A0AC60PHR7_IXOPE|nr:hypothetical protein HPB47_003684 [Ixodes persulcatus]